jgi:preprotein translocase subunit SecF
MWIVTHRKIFYVISVVLGIISLGSLLVWGLNLGIDFKGGSLLEVSYVGEKPASATIQEALKPLAVESTVREAGTYSYLIRMRHLSEPERLSVENALTKAGGDYSVKRFTSIGPVLGTEAAKKSIYSIIAVLVAILLFIAFVFRTVSAPVSSWKYGLIALIALLHDVFIPIGVFAILGHFIGTQVDTLFVTAILVVLGFSIHDTIVVFDRVREHLKDEQEKKDKKLPGPTKSFETIVGDSVSETFARSINTSLTTLFAVAVLYVVGGEATRNFSLALLIGITAGTYSSIFIASPLLVTVQKWQERRLANKS